jgi:hypothetical protein
VGRVVVPCTTRAPLFFVDIFSARHAHPMVSVLFAVLRGLRTVAGAASRYDIFAGLKSACRCALDANIAGHISRRG